MKPDDFEKLVVSIRQAGRIRAGTLEPARMTTLESPRMTSREILAFIQEGREAGLRHIRSKRKE
ncbi:MAG: hypothetical protein IPO52_14785 [Gemmatimonadetes bacterium]|jgi:hypothetical protein|nr:hypothetical protein [Gemmatimonadota bacterium]MBK9550326.1 hypothetical protein [Gemmatimonadota bacterium]MBP9105361.1 hypothetical protein [Gemmatimonadaceae bacterium]